MTDDPAPRYEPPEVEDLDTDGQPIDTTPGASGGSGGNN